MYFQHIFEETLAQGSYLIGCQTTGEALVIDPQRDIDIYLEVARKRNLKITHITETHIHADFLCGSRELAAVTGAKMYLSDEGGLDWQYEFEHEGLKDGDKLRLGNVSLDIMHTPGHTPESISFLMTDHAASDKPSMIFTGDFVFVGDVGRPDLLETAAGIKGTKEEGAKQMFQSLKRFSALPDYIQVWPAHGAGSACGKALGAVPNSTVGYEKIQNWALQFGNEEAAFVDSLLEGQPEPPKYFAMMKKLNQIDRPLLTKVPQQKKLSKEEFKAALDKGLTVIDTRKDKAFYRGFIPGSINIQNNKALATWCGWVLNYEQPFILVADDQDIDTITRKLMRIGLDKVYGYISKVKDMGIPLQKSELLDYHQFKTISSNDDVQIVDVRGKKDFEGGHIPNADHCFVGTLENHLNKINKDKTIIVHCQSGTRSTVAGSLLMKNGFGTVKNYAGGMADWLKHGEKIETGIKVKMDG